MACCAPGGALPRPAKPALELRGHIWHYAFTFRGKRFRGTTGERDRGRAESYLAARWYEEHQKAHVPVAVGPGVGLDLRRLAGMWLAALEREHPQRYVARHRLDVRYLLGVFKLPTDATNDAWQAAMRDMNAEGLAWSSLRHATVTLRHLLRFCASLGALAVVPEIRPPTNKLVRRTEAKRSALSAGERDRVLAAMRKAGDHRAARIWQAMAYSGLRKGELARLTLRWMDTEAGILRIPAAAAKSGEEEMIPLHPKARQAIRAEAADRGLARNARDVPVFGGFDIRKAWKRALRRARIDVPGLTAHHSARHTFGTILAQISRGDVTAVQAGGRWRSLAMVQRYVHASAERARAAMKRM